MFPEFTFANAIFYITKSPGPRGFIWKYLLSYVVLLVAVCAVSGFAMYPLFIEMEASGVFPSNGASFLALISPLLFLIFWAVHEGAIQRRLVQGRPFSIRLGRDELRLLGVGLLTGLFLTIIVSVASIISGTLFNAAYAVGSEALIWLIGIFVYVMVPFTLFGTMAKFSAAAALTVRDGKFRFGKSISITRGRFWRIFGTLVIHSVAYYIFFLIFYGFTAGFWVGFAMSDPTIGAAFATATFAQLLLVIFVSVLVLGSFALGGLYQLYMAGPGALAAVNDRYWEAGADAEADIFS